MKKFKITFTEATKDAYEGRKPWDTVRESGDDYVYADDANEAIESYIDYMTTPEVDSRLIERHDDEVFFYEDEDKEEYTVALNFEAEIVGMKPSELYDNCYKELSEKAINIIDTSDQFFDKSVGKFDSADDFNQFVEENYTDEDEEDE